MLFTQCQTATENWILFWQEKQKIANEILKDTTAKDTTAKEIAKSMRYWKSCTNSNHLLYKDKK